MTSKEKRGTNTHQTQEGLTQTGKRHETFSTTPSVYWGEIQYSTEYKVSHTTKEEVEKTHCDDKGAKGGERRRKTTSHQLADREDGDGTKLSSQEELAGEEPEDQTVLTEELGGSREQSELS
ncbi:hypothetical protein E2C01_054630 [Portunus trituberculatus]|uniref:Uncharacterized protein n=1 Tax=Portunus trituberculatus TaxID=210409 RepID=A0A5B7GSI8_PORTR|nr:hypothetical protein [Portunus trituberculatus]